MKKITDSDYRLPEIYPQRFNEHFLNSANKPLLISGIDKGTHEKGDYVVKLRGAGRMSAEASMRELLAGFIAMQMDIPVVEPVLIDIHPDFVDLLKGNDAWAVDWLRHFKGESLPSCGHRGCGDSFYNQLAAECYW